MDYTNNITYNILDNLDKLKNALIWSTYYDRSDSQNKLSVEVSLKEVTIDAR